MFNLLIIVIYLAFISLGLPDALLGSSWPIMHLEMNVPLSYAGIISMIIALGTIISSLLSDKLTKRFSSFKVTLVSVLLTAFALFGFSISSSFWMLVLFAIPYGIGAGGVDASLNNYVALNYSSKHMSWLHCMWGVGASFGPYIMSYSLINNGSWNDGYLIISIIQIILTFIILMSMPLWKNNKENEFQSVKSLSLKEIWNLKGARFIIIAFFCYCALEQTCGLWASSYLVIRFDIEEEVAALFASLFYLGITIGRFVNGFLTIKYSDKVLIRCGMIIIFIGIAFVFLPFNVILSYIGILIIGLGCAPIYPCIIHSTPYIFGEDKSQALVGVEMASAYLGTLLAPPLFGLIANYVSISLYPLYLLIILVVMFIMYERLVKIKSKNI